MGERLRPKYKVFRLPEMGVGEPNKPMKATDPDDIDSPFVLMPRKDPAAFAAMITYARYCEPSLANEIKAWLRKVVGAKPIFGTQGARNMQASRLKATQDIID